MKAGYSKNSAKKICEYLNPNNPQHQYIRDYIEKLKQEVREKSSLSKKDIIAKLEERIGIDISDIFDIKEIEIEKKVEKTEKNVDDIIKHKKQILVIDLKTYKKWKEKGYTKYLSSIGQDKSGNIKIEIIGLMETLDMLNRMQGNYAAQKVEVEGKNLLSDLYRAMREKENQAEKK